MRKRSFSMLILLLCSWQTTPACAVVSEFKWGQTRAEIETKHDLMEFIIPDMEKNLRKLCYKDEADGIVFYLLDQKATEQICGLTLFKFLGFYKDSLFAICYSTEELSPEYEIADEQCIQRAFFEPDTELKVSATIKNSRGGGGNIFGDASLVVFGDCVDRYVVQLESRGLSFFSPQHKQYAFLILEKTITDRIFQHSRIDPKQRELMPPTALFSVSLHEHEKDLRKPQKRLSDLKLRIMVGRKEDADFFNKLLREDDIIFTYGAKRRYLERITVPMKMFGRGNLSALEAEFEKLGDVVVDYIHYNPEQWKESHTPSEEVNDLVEAVKRARTLANKKNVKLSFGTDHVLLEKYGEKIAPLVDMFGIQLQRYQRETLEQFRKKAEELVSIVRRGSETVPIVFQVSLAPPMWKLVKKPDGETKKVIVRDKDGKKLYEPIKPEILIEQIEAIKNLGDGLAFLYTEETRDGLRKLVLQLRKQQDDNSHNN